MQWAKMGRGPILDNSIFIQKIEEFEKDEARAVFKTDLENILKSRIEEKATNKGHSALIVVAPTKRSMYNYMALLSQLDPTRYKSEKSAKEK